MDYQKYYEENKFELLKTLYEVGYTPHQLANEAYNENVTIYEYIYMLCSI